MLCNPPRLDLMLFRPGCGQNRCSKNTFTAPEVNSGRCARKPITTLGIPLPFKADPDTNPKPTYKGRDLGWVLFADAPAEPFTNVVTP